MFRHLFVVLLLALATIGTPATALAAPATGDLLIACSLDHTSGDDPIVFPGAPAATHNHQFYGGRGIDAFTTFPTLFRGTTSCQAPSDRSGYWTPTIKEPDGTYPTASSVQIYYRAGGREAADLQWFPMSLRHVQGDAKNTVPNNSKMTFTCMTATAGTTGAVTRIPTSCPIGSTKVRMSLYFSGCWDGMELDNATHKTLVPCNGANIAMPALQYFLDFPVAVAQPGVVLSCEMPGQPSNTCGHADFWNGWDPGVAQTILEKCLLANRPCRVKTDPITGQPVAYDFGTKEVLFPL